MPLVTSSKLPSSPASGLYGAISKPSPAAALYNKINPNPLPPPSAPISASTLGSDVRKGGLAINSIGSNAPTSLTQSKPVVIPKDQPAVVPNTNNQKIVPPATTTPSPSPAATTPPAPTNTGANATGTATFPGIVGSLNKIGTDPNANLGLYNSALTKLQSQLPDTLYNINTSGADLNFKQGEANQAENRAIGLQQALETGKQNALTGQSQAITALGSAGNLTSPTANAAFFGSPLSGGIVGEGNNLMTNAVNQAVQLVKNGAANNDPAVQNLLAPFGAPASQAFTQALNSGGSYNPTIQSATAGQNASQATTYQGLATQLDTSLKNLDNVSTTAVNFLNSNGLLNPTQNKNYNAPINKYISNVTDPTGYATYQNIIADLNNFKSQILSANTGQTPTALTQSVEATDPSTLSAPELQQYLQNLSLLGKQQLAVYQGQSQASGGGGYAGAPATVNTNLNATPNGGVGITPLQAGQAGSATLFSAPEALIGFAKSLF